MPVFFLVGGYVNARSWPAHRARGETRTEWVRDRALRLLWPTAVFVLAGTLAASVALLAGAPGGEVGEAGWLVALHLWFLPVYLLLAALTPPLLAAHRRWGLRVPVVMAAGAALVSAGVTGAHLHVIGYANYLLVWGSAQQWGFALACEPAGTLLLSRPGLWRRVRRLNATVLTVYLWHFVPVIIVAAACCRSRPSGPRAGGNCVPCGSRCSRWCSRR